jgi:hypothetical protein
VVVVAVVVMVVVLEVALEAHLHQDCHRQPDRMYPHPEEKSKPWDNSHKSSWETEARPTISSTNSVNTCG